MRYFVKVRTTSGAEYFGKSTELTDEEKEEILSKFEKLQELIGFRLEDSNHCTICFNMSHVESVSLEAV